MLASLPIVGVRDVGEAVAVGIVAEGRMRDPRVRRRSRHTGPKHGVGQRAALVDRRLLGQARHRRSSSVPAIGALDQLAAQEPDRLSIAITIRMIRTM